MARSGIKRTSKLAQLSAEMEYLLSVPQRITSPEALVKARTTVKKSQAVIKPQYKKTAEQLQALEKLVSQASVPAQVSIQSDNQTQIDIYKVGRYQPFQHKELSLRPGSYTVVGSREGYRDVRRQLNIKLGQSRVQLAIQCVELI
ncbi:MAG: hypothetical protein KZQ58_09665 [gamma proteobacterium symbiont of Bathyaustriella thionipta]|nr:hypothetical protein [gamma proteobacterium symbiont of Bathyaustriella thionipta]